MRQKQVTQLDWSRAIELLQEASNLILVTHVRPDGDAIGSLVGLGLALEQQGKHAYLVVDCGQPSAFRFLEGTEKILAILPNSQIDLVVALDGSDLQILGDCGAEAFQLDVPKLVIDHHATNDLFGSLHIVSSEYVSTTHIVHDLLNRLGWKISLPVATALLLGTVTDTQCFRVGPITTDTFTCVQELLAIGADLRGIVERTVMSVPHGQLKVLGYVVTRANLENHVIWASLSQTEIQALDPEVVRSSHLSDELLKDDEAFVSAFFQEVEDGVRVSMRAVPGFNIGELADSLGGGGHLLAGGVTLKDMNLTTAIALVVDKLKTVVKQGKPVYER